MPPIQDHPLRYQLANELHARPFPTMSNPSTVIYLAIKQPQEAVHRDRSRDLAHLIELLDRHGVPHPKPGATHHSAQLGRHTLKWEQHTEFVSYTLYFDGISERPYDPADFDVFPSDWLSEAPGQRITSLMLRVLPRGEVADVRRALTDWFVPESLAVARVLDDSCVVAGDFRIDPAGHMRFAVFPNTETGAQRIGRVVQRLCEIETYRAMSMLGFSRARGLSPTIGALDTHLSEMMVEMTGDRMPAEQTLSQLLIVSAELEAMAAQAAFRFGATGAYDALVNQRIALLREARFEGYQTFAEFMLRRFEPAMRTVKSTEGRLATLADRARRAGELLRTRVDVERSAQNQALLESMDRRADMALRLQHTVEGLSVVAISYYAVSLASYALYPLAAVLGLSKGMMTAALTLPVVLMVWLAVRQIRKRLH
ncbi:MULTISPECIES: DUF3422 family protein [Phaeobacter]|uniref:Membrane-anchored protein in bacteria n=1 Tax=Phaeobacter piscinae TaxID=1580596 RepID=A0AAN1GQ04_9RHOB|nr:MULTISPECIES: DUF3422 domain-containing protein [Phaeobacter]ATG35078.1 putative membrane-anchored protein in bacteria [Phaeobacter piscinae]ATG39040.1 putative membrane-anchored protein in bacteria [Phaeobacter piscinae]ATG42881.1 putative membrane-anchored protein in bacteria [Phaeobacter piscinae]AUQ74968.1 putative membrane-anchored protein in bacteria [Phaeobacter piscinae]AUQ85598.1 putative membrane-anchored protein in bacteria [Phaeobacter piscinae]